jgi:hypothetical protein
LRADAVPASPGLAGLRARYPVSSGPIDEGA